MTSPVEQLASALTATLADRTRRSPEASRPPATGWHPGARIGATAARGALAAYHDSGAAGICVLQDGRGVWLNTQSAERSWDFARRPYAVWQWTPSYNGQPTWLIGALAPGAARVELVREDGGVGRADVVDRTFAVEMEIDMVTLRDAKARLEATESTSAEGRAEFEKLLSESRAEMSKVRVRVYDDADALLYDGPSISSDD
ncbi:hypothetical protein [Saccharothrix australiensis]|uniref:Uncharacterized protein n=1 Tax=Saccharothrix australiensis TaxID=2072 RepID=A0A495VWR9_9PSEU|nr:hypothetical protein [Saccharothrix australiensis]RKT53664.1 hypothetical protein C8E97_2243 [Saccharothrix australiensis]